MRQHAFALLRCLSNLAELRHALHVEWTETINGGGVNADLRVEGQGVHVGLDLLLWNEPQVDVLDVLKGRVGGQTTPSHPATQRVGRDVQGGCA